MMKIEIFSKIVDEISFRVWYVNSNDGSYIRFEEIHLPSKEMLYAEISLGDALLVAKHIEQIVEVDFDIEQYLAGESSDEGMYS